ncbi:MAG: glycosyltransferase family 2 protein [Bacilli bacterium]|nr:glycosyltransferase family 2 protein [Bacilli bacterium]MBR6056429.1 glycosyltransferase family 2 protein [Bacilli bacterium]
MNKPVVSIIMPVFRNKDTLARALDSFLEQDFEEPSELIMGIDDANDGTFALAKEYSEKHPDKIKMHTEDYRMGQALSRWKAIMDSQGEYIYFMDADDRLRKDCLSTLVKTMRNTGADCVNCSFYQVDEKEKEKAFFSSSSATYNKKEAITAFLWDISFRGFLWTKMWKREIIEKRPLLLLSDHKDMFEDVAFCLSMLSYCEKVVCIKDPLYYYYKNVPTSAMSVHRTDRAERHLWVFALIRDFLEKNQDKNLIEAFKKTTFRSYLSLLFDLSLDKKYGATKIYLKNVKTEWKELKNLKKPLPQSGRSYTPLLERAWLN